MDKKEENKVTKKWQRLMVVAGGIFLLSMGSALTGCASQTSAPAQTTQVETTEDEHRFDVNIPLTGADATQSTKDVVETVPGGGEVGVTADGETVHDMGVYGDLGKDFFEANIIANWKNYTIPDEQTLRERIDTIYEDLSTKEELVQIVLATPRDAQPTQAQTQSETQATQTPNSNNNNTGNNTGSGSKETKATTTPKETKSNNGGNTATPPPTSTTVTPEQKAEFERRKQEAEAKSGTNVDDSRGGSAPKRDADDAVKQWQWQ